MSLLSIDRSIEKMLLFSKDFATKFSFICAFDETMLTTKSQSFLSAIDAERKDDRMTDRPSFLSATNAERKEERKKYRPSFFLHLMQEERKSGQQTDHPFFLQLVQKERMSNVSLNKQIQIAQTTLDDFLSSFMISR